jgi:hypothetical protein
VRIVRARLGSNAGIIGATIHVNSQRIKAGTQT